MADGFLVFRDGESSLDDLIARAHENPLRLSPNEVTVEEPGRAVEGENWRPQLAPYRPWVHDAALDEGDGPNGTDGDLLVVGALGMGISDEERMALIGAAVTGKATGEVAGSGVATEKVAQTSSSGTSASTCETLQNRETRGINRGTEETDRETLSQLCETSCDNRETIDNNGNAHPAEGFAIQVPLSVRRDGAGFALSAVHLSVLADEGLPADDLVVTVPAYIGDMPVVRVASEAFARRYTSGARVRLLIVPDTVEVVGSQAFGSVCAEAVYLGAGVETYDPAPLDLDLPNPRLERRAYRVSPENAHFSVEGGCLLRTVGQAPQQVAEGGLTAVQLAETQDAGERPAVAQGEAVRPAALRGVTTRLSEECPTRLLFADAPYGERLAIPEGVAIVGPAAFAKGCPSPRVIDAPATLGRVEGSVRPETLWRGADPAALAAVVARCGGRVTDFQAREEDLCWYDFPQGEPPSAPGLRPSAQDGRGSSPAADGGPVGAGFSPPSPARDENPPVILSERSEPKDLAPLHAEARLVAGPPAPDSVSRRFSSAARARVRGGAALSPREIAADAANGLVAPVSSSDRLALPRAVRGVPLATIADRALLTAPATLVIPETVRDIRDGNICAGTRKLMLFEGLRAIGAHCFCSRSLEGPVLIPASVTSIGVGSFEYAVVRFAHPATGGAVVHITSDQLMSCFLEDPADGIPFDFIRYDDQLLAGRGLPDHLGALLHRLAAPYRLKPALRDRIVGALGEREAETIAAVAREGDINTVRALAEAGFLDDAHRFDRQIERLRASNRTDCVLYLMNWQHEKQGTTPVPQSARARFAI